MGSSKSFVVFNSAYIEGGSSGGMILVSADSAKSAAEKLGAKLEDQSDTGSWKLSVPAESYEPFTEEMVGPEQFAHLTRDGEEHWPGGAYAFYRAGVVLATLPGKALQEEDGSKFRLTIAQPPQFLS